MEREFSRRPAVALAALLLAGCGGGGGGGGFSSSGDTANPASTWKSGTFEPSTQFESLCAAPRSGIDPYTGQAYPDQRGSTLTEKQWLRSWSHEVYLWSNEIADRNPALYSTTSSYFDVLRTTALSGTGQDKDRFHFTYPTPVWEALSGDGAELGYGASFALLSALPPRSTRVAYVEPGSAAADAGLVRGTEVLFVDGIDLVNDNTQSGVDVLNAGMFPETSGEVHNLVVRDPGSLTTRLVSLRSASVISTPVQQVETIPTPTGTVGYMLFNDHVATAEAALASAFAQLRDAQVSDLVLDIRYNGGGYGDIASEVAYMIAGPAATSGRTFELQQFNAAHPTVNPVTGRAIAPMPFHDTAQGFSLPQGQALPTLNLPRVYVLTGSGTCSASESIINGLRGVGVQVIQVGATTCGKPYGFYPQDNCGTTYFSIEFRLLNALGFGDYADGFAPPETTGGGCWEADDFDHALGDAAEGRLAAALYHRENGSCPIFMKSYRSAGEAVYMHKSPWRENQILRKR